MVLEATLGFVSLVIALFVPGYFITLAFFAKKGEISSLERVTLSFVLSITFLPLLVLFENIALKIPINIYSVGGSFALLILVGLLTYLWRTRIQNPPSLCQKLMPSVPREEAVPIIPWIKK